MKRVTGAARTTEVSARERQSEEIAYQAALEGIVLLETEIMHFRFDRAELPFTAPVRRGP